MTISYMLIDVIIPPIVNSYGVGLGVFGVTCSPRDPRFAGSNPADVDGFFQDVKILPEGL